MNISPTQNSRKRPRFAETLNASFKEIEHSLIHNYFSELADQTCERVKKIRRASRSFPGHTGQDLQHLADNILNIPEMNLRNHYLITSTLMDNLLSKLNLIIQEQESTRRHRQVLWELRKICASCYTRINARAVHVKVIELFTRPRLRSDNSNVKIILNEIPESRQSDLIQNLAQIWCSMKKQCRHLKADWFVNLPNLVFHLKNHEDGSLINVVRFRSPELCPVREMIDPKYQAMMEHYKAYQKKHIDFSLVSPTCFEPEITVHQLRHELQFEYPNSLFSWAADTYSDFALQTNRNPYLSARVFIREFMDKIMNQKERHFVIPEDFLMADFLQNLLSDVHYEIFDCKRNLTLSERKDFVVIALVYILEFYCDEFRPDSLDTACRSHIDRGMVITTLFYLYSLIKSKKIDDEECLEYLKPIIFSPSLLVAKRPTHIERIRRLLSAMSRFFDPIVIKRIQNHRSYLNGFTPIIPHVKSS